MPFCVTQRASKSVCRNRPGFSYHPSGNLPALIYWFWSQMLQCLGYGTKNALIIRPPWAWRLCDPRNSSDISKSFTITLALRSLSLKKATVVAPVLRFIRPRPTKSSNDRTSLTWNSGYSTLRLKKLLEYYNLKMNVRIDSLAACFAHALLLISLFNQ